MKPWDINIHIQKGTTTREGGKAAALEKDWSREPDN